MIVTLSAMNDNANPRKIVVTWIPVKTQYVCYGKSILAGGVHDRAAHEFIRLQGGVATRERFTLLPD